MGFGRASIGLLTTSSSDEFFSVVNRRTVLRASALGVLFYSIVVLIYAHTVPHLGLQVSGRLVRGVTIAPVAGPMPETGDEIVRIAGRTIDSFPVYVNTLAYLNRSDRFPAEAVASVDKLTSGTSPVLTVQNVRFARIDFRSRNDGNLYSSWFMVRDLPWQTTIISLVWFAMESFVFWMGWVVYRRRPEDDSAALFFLMCIVTVGAYMGGLYWLQIASSPMLIFVFAICAMSVPQVSCHFFLVFPSPKPFLSRYPLLPLAAIYIIPALVQLGVLWTIGSVISSFRHDQPVARIDDSLARLWWLVRIYLGMSAALFSACLGSLVHSYVSAKQAIHRNQVRWILGGALLAGFFLGYSGYLAVTNPVRFALGGATWSMLCSSMVFTCAYAVSITRHRMMYVDDMLERGVLYLLMTFAGSLLYYGLLFLAIWFSPRLTTDTSQGQVLLVTAAILLVLVCLNTIRSRVQKVLDRRFYREKHSLDRAMRRMDEAVGQLVDQGTVVRRSLHVLGDILAAPEAAIYLRGSRGFELAQRIGSREFPAVIPSDSELARLVERERLAQASPGPLLAGDSTTLLLKRYGVEIAQAFSIDDKLLGFLLVAPRGSSIYSSEELEFVDGLAQLVVLALHGAQTQRTLESLNEDLRVKVERISRQIELRTMQDRAVAVTETPVEPDARPFEGEAIRGASPAVVDMIRTARKVAGSNATVLIRGESGTGKTLLAEAVHRNSPRAGGPFVKVHCAALSPGLLESELFGHVKGAFTGAHRDKVGRFQLADGGTLFLDEIGDISLDVQTKLLRVLQEMTFEPVGSNESRTVDVRIIAATHQPIEDLVRRNRIREDLYYRLNVISLWVPPLRERREDILALALHFLARAGERSGRPLSGFEDEAIERLLSHSWPGNIRELENAIERAAVLAAGPLVSVADLPAEIAPLEVSGRAGSRAPAGFRSDRPPSNALEGEIASIEIARLRAALAAHGGNKSKAAQALGMPRTTLCSKLKKYNFA